MHACIFKYVYMQDDYVYMQYNCVLFHTLQNIFMLLKKHKQWCPSKATVGQRWIPFNVFCDLLLKKGWTKGRVAGDLRRHNVHVI